MPYSPDDRRRNNTRNEDPGNAGNRSRRDYASTYEAGYGPNESEDDSGSAPDESRDTVEERYGRGDRRGDSVDYVAIERMVEDILRKRNDADSEVEGVGLSVDLDRPGSYHGLRFSGSNVSNTIVWERPNDGPLALSVFNRTKGDSLLSIHEDGTKAELSGILGLNSEARKDEWAGLYVYRGGNSDGLGQGLAEKGIVWNPVDDVWGFADVDSIAQQKVLTSTFDEIASVGKDVTITGSWDHSTALTFSGATNQLQFVDGTSTIYWGKDDASSIAFRVYDNTLSTSLAELSYGGDLSVPNGSLTTSADVTVGQALHVTGYGDTHLGRVGQHDYITFDKDFNLYFRTYDGGNYLDKVWIDNLGIKANGYFRTSDYASGWTGSGCAMEKGGFAEMTELSVRGTLIAREFELRKLRFSKGPRADTVGGGKIKEIYGEGEDSYGKWFDVRFEEPPGLNPEIDSDGTVLGVPDYVMIQESDVSVNPESNNGVQGSGYITRQVRLITWKRHTANKFRLYYTDGQGNRVTAANYNYAPPMAGDDCVVLASESSARDSLIFYDPYGPFIDVLDGISNFDAWDSRSPKIRLGFLDGAPTLTSGKQPVGYGLYADNVYLEGHLESTSGLIGGWSLEDGAISSVVDGVEMALGNASSGVSWSTAVRGLQIGTDSSNRMWFGKVNTDYDMRVTVNGNDLVQLGSITNQISGFSINSDRINKTFSGGVRLSMGSDADVYWKRKGFFAVIPSNGMHAGIAGRYDLEQVGVIVDNGNGSSSNGSYISIGNDHYRGGSFGMTVFNQGKTVFETGPNSAYISNLDIAGTLTMGSSGEITDPNSNYTIDQNGFTVRGEGGWSNTEDALTIDFIDNNNKGWGKLYLTSAYDGNYHIVRLVAEVENEYGYRDKKILAEANSNN